MGTPKLCMHSPRRGTKAQAMVRGASDACCARVLRMDSKMIQSDHRHIATKGHSLTRQ